MALVSMTIFANASFFAHYDPLAGMGPFHLTFNRHLPTKETFVP
jgi:hypothetical protein